MLAYSEGAFTARSHKHDSVSSEVPPPCSPCRVCDTSDEKNTGDVYKPSNHSVITHDYYKSVVVLFGLRFQFMHKSPNYIIHFLQLTLHFRVSTMMLVPTMIDAQKMSNQELPGSVDRMRIWDVNARGCESPSFLSHFLP